MIGRRVEPDIPREAMMPGDYRRRLEEGFVTDHWDVCLPNGIHTAISDKVHSVTEHPDGTITVSPSILLEAGDPKWTWHGYLEHGVWRSC